MATADATFATETPADFGTDEAGVASRWISELDLAEKDRKRWKAEADRVIRRYAESENEASTDSKQRRYALLWSNIETLEPAVFARVPTAVVSRRWEDADPVGRIASEVLERALNFMLESVDFLDVMGGVRKDFLLTARGVTWVRYVPHMQTVTPPPALAAPAATTPDGQPDLEGGEQQDAEDGQVADGAEPYDVVAWEEVIPDHVAFDDFFHNAARMWSEVRWVARCAYMTRDELKERFTAETDDGRTLGEVIPLDHGADDKDGGGPDDDREQWSKAAIYEIWDKPSRKAIWVSKAYSASVLDEREDPLGLKDFFPCPRPALGTTSPKSIQPIPDYNYYRSQDKDINELTIRIGLLSDALKVRGFYAAGGEQKDKLQDLLTSETNTLVPVDSWAAFQDKGGIQGMIAWVPIDMIATTLKGCIEARTQLLSDVYQITGMSDIMRGDVDPDETATATRTKTNWGSSRVRNKQNELARVARDTLAIMGQIIASKFDPKTLAGMSNVQLLPDQIAKQQLQMQLQAQAQQAQAAQQHAQAAAQQAQQTGQPAPPMPAPFKPPPEMLQQLGDPTWEDVTGLLRDNVLRTFRLDIESDSTIEPNDQDEKERSIEFLEAVGSYVSKSIPAIQLMPAMAPVIAQGLLFLVRRFRVGREMEDVIQQAMDQLQSTGGQGAPQQQKPPPGPNPQVEAMKGQAALIGAHAKMSDAQTNQFRAQTDRMEAQAGASLDARRISVEQQNEHLQQRQDVALHGQDIAADLQKSVVQGVGRRFVHDMNPDRPIEAPTP
jgi:hypothetical protein